MMYWTDREADAERRVAEYHSNVARLVAGELERQHDIRVERPWSRDASDIFSRTPDWISSDTPYSTGGALVDLNRDGWVDFVVANGNDIRRERLVVYYNNGDGTLPVSPQWSSADTEYNGHLSVADVNGDGWLDVAVGLTMDDLGTATARLYLNNAGILSYLPDWESPDELAAFHVAFGDVNGDGRPDLAVGTGFPYIGSHPWHNQIYLNVGGMLEASASWVSSDTRDYMDVFFCDVNNDGWLDLVGVGTNTDTWVYMNNAGVMDTVASWRTTDNAGQFSVMGTYGDVDQDGWVDLFITDNIQLFGGTGDFRRYDGLAGGYFTAAPTWTFYGEYGSAVTLADIDADGDLDLATGGWWSGTRYFLNAAGLFSSSPHWSSTELSVVEAIVFGDVNKDGLRYSIESFDVSAVPGWGLFQLSRQPVEGIEYVTVDGTPLDADQFTFDAVHGWVSVGVEPTASVTVAYSYSLKPDMAVTNWDDSRGNYLHYNANDVVWFGDFDGDGDVDSDDFEQFELCFTGVGGGPVVPECRPGDFDLDDDIDCDDWFGFGEAWTDPAVLPELADCPLIVVLPASPPHDGPKNRYLSITPNGNPQGVALQVELVSMKRCSGDLSRACRVDAECPDICDTDDTITCEDAAVCGGGACVSSGPCVEHPDVGLSWWVQRPKQVDDGCMPSCTDEDWIARLAPGDMHFQRWTLNTLHIGDCEIIPVATYAIRACLPPDALSCCDPLLIGTIEQPLVGPGAVGHYGDVAGAVDIDTGQFAPPDGFVNVVDVQGFLLTKLNYGTGVLPFTHPTWTDLEGGGPVPQYILTVGDLQQILKAIGGDPYTRSPVNLQPGDCNP
jgi:hypothetical protein